MNRHRFIPKKGEDKTMGPRVLTQSSRSKKRTVLALHKKLVKRFGVDHNLTEEQIKEFVLKEMK